MGTVAIKALEFVDDIADLNSWSENAANSNKIIVGIQERKSLTFAAEKCRILKINSFDFSNTVCVKGEDLKVVTQLKYLGDVLNSRGDNSEKRIPVGNTEPFQMNNIIKQGKVLGPVLDNCSLDDNCA